MAFKVFKTWANWDSAHEEEVAEFQTKQEADKSAAQRNEEYKKKYQYPGAFFKVKEA